MQENVCPFDEDECVKRDDELWVEYAKQYIDLSSKIKSLSEQQERIKNHLIYLSASKNTQGGGVSLKKVERIGNIDYSKVHELQNVDLEMYRKASTSTWRISLS